MASYAAQIEACYAERAAQPEQLLTLDEMLVLSGLGNCIPVALPTVPRRVDSATHRFQPPKASGPSEPSPMLRRPLPAEDSDDWNPFDNDARARIHERDEDKRILEVGRQLPHMRGWRTRPSQKEIEHADWLLSARRPNNIRRSNEKVDAERRARKERQIARYGMLHAASMF